MYAFLFYSLTNKSLDAIKTLGTICPPIPPPCLSLILLVTARIVLSPLMTHIFFFLHTVLSLPSYQFYPLLNPF